MKAVNRKRIFLYLQGRLETALGNRYPGYKSTGDFVEGYNPEKGFFIGLNFKHSNDDWYLEIEMHDDEAKEFLTEITTEIAKT